MVVQVLMVQSANSRLHTGLDHESAGTGSEPLAETGSAPPPFVRGITNLTEGRAPADARHRMGIHHASYTPQRMCRARYRGAHKNCRECRKCDFSLHAGE